MTKKKPMIYETITGLRKINLSRLDDYELAFLREVVAFLKTKPDWNEFTNQLHLLRHKYQIQQNSPALVIGNDLDARNGIARGKVAMPNYQDKLYDLIKEKSGNLESFYQKTGISAAMLGIILAGGGSIRDLETIADKLGYRVMLKSKENDLEIRAKISPQKAIKMLRGI